MKVCIAEKPSVAREIAKIVGASQKKNGYFEGNGYQITWTFGHLCTLKEPHDYDSTLKRWDMVTLPIIPIKFAIKLIDNDGTKQQFRIIENLVQNAAEVINCGDAGQEGELIQRWVLHQAKCNVPVKRLWISSLTEEAIRKGFQNLQSEKEFDLLYAAGSARAIGDWLLGINATRLYTIKYGGYKQLLSIGRVQTPTLALITNRYLEIQNFKSEKYWELKTKYREVTFNATKGRFEKEEEVKATLESIKGKEFEIVSFKRKEGSETHPYLFDLTSLQVECNKKFSFSAEQTLKIAQSLYEKKFLTYPRVDTTFLPNNLYPEIGPTLKALTKFAQETAPLFGKPFRKTKKVFNDQKVTDHHAIIPTKISARGLTSQEAAVYDLVAIRFIAAFYPDCKVAKTEVLGKVEQIEFKTTGREVLEPGWRILFKKEEEEEKKRKKKKGDEEEEQTLPTFQQGERGPHAPFIKNKETKPPKLYTEATLLRAMETAGKNIDDEELRKAMKENGIGRPSTRANIIETLFKRKYIEKQRKSLVPTQAGLSLIQTIQNELLKSAELTGIWEKKLRQIEDGDYDINLFMNEIKEMVTEVVQNVKMRRSNFKIETPTASLPKTSTTKKKTPQKDIKLTCPKCKTREVLKGNSAYGCLGWKNKSCDFLIPFKYENKKLTDKQIQSLILKGSTPEIKGLKIDGATANGILKLDDNYKITFQKIEEKPLICPKCQKGQILEGKTAFGCGNWKSGCDFRVNYEIYGKKITKSQLKSLIQKGTTSKIKGFSENPHKISEGRLKLNPDFTITIIN